MRILVTGGTGNVGRLVVEQVARHGADVRVVSRNPGDGMMRGDLADPETLVPALRGVDRMYLFPCPGTAAEVVRLARQAGVRRIVTLSSGAVTTGYDTDFHLPVERAVEASGLEWTHVRPAEFMLNNLWLWGPSIRAERTVREPFPDRTGQPVHERDIAEVAAAALLGEGHHGVAYTLYGPEPISRRDQVRAIGEALGEEVRLEVVSPARAREMYLAQGGFAAASADFLTGFQSYSAGTPDPVPAPAGQPAAPVRMPTAEDVTGRPARTFAEWARDHAEDFG
ncbi:nucleotide-diphosphate-sugar epimerase [Actinoplanes ianthinogenes]|uniref:Nucleotide-diphosphate-sugar epimerase n=1 Tax=Actinoplanes ianthinogenes TaxID=122358 RepID=A0ABM7M9P9_9ACTN|nr:NAD(P)H-binding protein [Actinoplanes ianthinogenes]BCJ48348.1 nucleotide-diphosphate-sugar epimerase [Actinoplanes ianthinogenes]GGR46982.1 nucleotide-diphosphate-sugar epimerase [Actinoplanes ianthinogenes]